MFRGVRVYLLIAVTVGITSTFQGLQAEKTEFTRHIVNNLPSRWIDLYVDQNKRQVWAVTNFLKLHRGLYPRRPLLIGEIVEISGNIRFIGHINITGPPKIYASYLGRGVHERLTVYFKIVRGKYTPYFVDHWHEYFFAPSRPFQSPVTPASQFLTPHCLDVLHYYLIPGTEYVQFDGYGGIRPLYPKPHFRYSDSYLSQYESRVYEMPR